MTPLIIFILLATALLIARSFYRRARRLKERVPLDLDDESVVRTSYAPSADPVDSQYPLDESASERWPPEVEFPPTTSAAAVNDALVSHDASLSTGQYDNEVEPTSIRVQIPVNPGERPSGKKKVDSIDAAEEANTTQKHEVQVLSGEETETSQSMANREESTMGIANKPPLHRDVIEPVALLPERAQTNKDVSDANQRTIHTIEIIEAEKRTVPHSREADPVEDNATYQLPTYRPLAPPPAAAPKGTRQAKAQSTVSRASIDLQLRVQLVFARSGEIKTFMLVPDCNESMPNEIEIKGAQGKLCLRNGGNDAYESIPLLEPSTVLREGAEWHGRAESDNFRWRLSGREIHVLGSGEVSGLYPFGTTPRLSLNACHAVVSTSRLRDEVRSALQEAGCSDFEELDETRLGVPAGWVLFRKVIPTRAVPMRDKASIMNALCPLSDIEPHFIGGIHIARRTWLLGYPPEIRLTGDLDAAEIKVDGLPATVTSDGIVTGSGWDTGGEHQLWFSGQTQTYLLRSMEEDWERWPANRFGLGATICGASLQPAIQSDKTNRVQVVAPNPLFIGARPGEVFYFQRDDVRWTTLVTYIPFEPVWALPADPAHAGKSAQILLLKKKEPEAPRMKEASVSRAMRLKLQRWVSALNTASKKRLTIEPSGEDAMALWVHYRSIARQLRRKLR